MQGNHQARTEDTTEKDKDAVDSTQFVADQEELTSLRRIVQEQEEELTSIKALKESGTKPSRPQPVQEEAIQAVKTSVAENKPLGDRDIEIIRQDVFNLSQAGNSRSYNAEDFSFGSTASISDGVPARIQALLDRLHGLGEDLLSASDFEYLQRHLYSRPDESIGSGDTAAWSKERNALLDAITAVKGLLQQADRLAEKSVEELSGSGDWRGDLLESLVHVYQNEKQVLRAEVGTADTRYPEMDIVTQLESRIHDLERVQQTGLDEMLRADRQSLVDEVDGLHHRLLEAQAELQDTRSTLDQRIAALEEAKVKAEWQLQKQIQMLEYKIQQEGVIQEDLKKSLNLERQRVSELSSQSSQERSKTFELQSELSSTQIQLSKVRDALEREQHRFNSVTDALEEEQAKTTHLADLLDSTKRKLNSFKQEVAHNEARHQEEAESEGVHSMELRQELEKARQQSFDSYQAEEQAQKRIHALSEKVDNLKVKLASTKEDYEAKVEQLHREWMDREVQDRKERESETVTKLTDLLDVERQSHKMALDNERQLMSQMKDVMEQIKSENDRLLDLYEMEKSRADKLKKEFDANQPSNDMIRLLRTSEKEATELQNKVVELESELSTVQERAATLEAELLRGKGNNRSTGSSNLMAGEYHRDALTSLMTASVIDEELKVRLAQCCTRLQMIASKLKDMSGQDKNGGEDFVDGECEEEGEATGLQRVMEELEKLKANIREREEKRINSSERVPEQLLQHNKQLAEHITKLKMEKEELAAAMRKMEQRIGSGPKDRNVKVSLPQYTSDVTSDEEVVYDRTVWASEKLSLQMALDSADHEIQRLRSELRRFSSLTKADGQLIKLDPDKTQRLYGKYLRAESFRKALIYQKKYLLLLLGGYRDTEKETLAILASMGGYPSPRTSQLHQQGRSTGEHRLLADTRPLSAFRSAGRAVISIFRMKYLVRKWKRATRVGSPVMTGQITIQHAYIPNSSSSYSLPHSRQPVQSLPQQLHHHPPHHQNRSNSPSSSSSSPTHPVPINSAMSSSDYIESLTNGGLSSLKYSNSSRLNQSSTTASSHQMPSHHQNHNHQHQQGPTNNYNTTPPTKDSSKYQQNHKAARGNKDSAKRQIFPEVATDFDSPRSQRTGSNQSLGHSADSDDENFMRYLENVQQHLSEGPSLSSRRVTWR